jgi:hypothetical protein
MGHQYKKNKLRKKKEIAKVKSSLVKTVQQKRKDGVVVEKRVLTLKKRRMLQVHNSSRKRQILIFVHDSQEKWAGQTRDLEIAHIEVVYVKKQMDVIDYLKKKDPGEYDVIILAPCHGFHDKPQIIWDNVRKKQGTLTLTCVKASLKVATHVHICTCYQGILSLFAIEIY